MPNAHPQGAATDGASFFARDRRFSGVEVRPEAFESIDAAIKRFKKITQRSLILVDARRHEFFIPKPERRRHKQIAARRRRGTHDG